MTNGRTPAFEPLPAFYAPTIHAREASGLYPLHPGAQGHLRRPAGWKRGPPHLHPSASAAPACGREAWRRPTTSAGLASATSARCRRTGSTCASARSSPPARRSRTSSADIQCEKLKLWAKAAKEKGRPWFRRDSFRHADERRLTEIEDELVKTVMTNMALRAGKAAGKSPFHLEDNAQTRAITLKNRQEPPRARPDLRPQLSSRFIGACDKNWTYAPQIPQ